MAPIQSLRRRLQTTTFLAVLAGYAVLLGLNKGLDLLQRRAEHTTLVAALQRQIVAGELALPPSRPLPLPSGSVQLERVAAAAAQPPRLERRGGRVWMVSTSAFSLAAGPPVGMRVREEVTAELAQQDQSYLMLAAVAGISSLVTSALLRPVLRAGLLQPLGQLSAALAAAPGPRAHLNAAAIQPLGHPQELRPIVSAFNDLQRRLATTWEQQRTLIDGVGHELRTPLTLIHGYGQRLQRSLAAGQPADQQAASAILAEAERATALVRDLLDLARSEAGRFDLRLARLDAAHQLVLSYERLEPLAGGRLRLEAPPADLNLSVEADPERLHQCLANLIDNALKYAPAPSPVELAVALQEGSAGGLVVFHIRDHGPGVPAAERQRVFELFQRGSQGAVVSGGTGVGLAMVKLLAERMGGRVQVSDRPGGGADFQLLLPAA